MDPQAQWYDWQLRNSIVIILTHRTPRSAYRVDGAVRILFRGQTRSHRYAHDPLIAPAGSTHEARSVRLDVLDHLTRQVVPDFR